MILQLLLLFSTIGYCQDSKIHPVQDFTGGMNTWQNSLIIGDNESPLAQNVILDKSFGVTRREGYEKRNVTAIGDGSSDVNAMYQLERSNGIKYCVAFSSTNGYGGTDACQTFTAFVSTLTRNNDVNCEAIQDRLYCVNNQYNFYFDGTNDYAISALPANADFIRVHRNRCFVGGNSTNPSRLFYSALSDCTSWTTSTDYIDISPEDGDVLVGIGKPIFDMLPIYKKFSTWVLKGTGPSTFVLLNISKETGAKNHRAIANYKSKQYFDSLGPNGGKPGIYSFNGIIIEEASLKLRNEIDQLDTFRANAGQRLITSKGDFDAGTFDSRAMSSSRDSGFMQSSYTTRTDTIAGDWAGGTFDGVSTTSVSGSMVLTQSSSGSFINAGCEQCTGASSSDINWSSKSFNGIDTNSPMYGSYMWRDTGGSCGTEYLVQILDTNQNILKTYSQTITDGKTATALDVDVSTVAEAMVRLRVYWESGGAENISVPFIRQQTIKFKSKDGPGAGCDLVWDVDEASHTLVGTYTSQIFDTAISTPIWGTWETSITSAALTTATGTVTVQVRVSTAGDGGGFDAYATPTIGAELANAQKRYIQYQTRFEVVRTTNTPGRLNAAEWAAASTGTWTSAELFLSNNISAGGWGLFQAVETESGSEALVSYAIRVATYSGGTASAAWAVQTNNAAITLSTGAYIQVRSTHTVGVATETAKLDSITLNWNEGAQAVSATMEVFNGRLHYGAQSLNGSRNDTIYVLDQNGAWTKWTGVRPRHLSVVNQNFVMADSSTTSAGFIMKLYTGESDNGGVFQAIYDSKDFTLGSMERIKSIERVYVIHKSSNTTLTVTPAVDAGLRSQSYSINLSTGAPFGIRPIVLHPPQNGNSVRIRFTNTAADKPWEIIGYGIYYRDIGLMP